MKVYLAGPDVFLPKAREIGARKVALCARYGLTGLFPLDNEVDAALPDAAQRIFCSNEAMMDSSDAVVANLTPFRGPSADAGTVYELGYMIGRGKIALGYCNDPTPYAERVARGAALRTNAAGRLIDTDGLEVENFGGIDNLMITEGLSLHGHVLVVAPVLPADPLRDLALFERCLRRLAGAAPP